MKTNKPAIFFSFLCLLLALTAPTFAQTTQFTYQGRLLDSSMPPTASYDFEFRLFSSATGGTAIGTIQRTSIAVTNGTFNVQLDFGAQFSGTTRYLEIAVKPAGSGSLTTLSPRQPVTSAPYSIRSLAAANADTATNSFLLGGLAASQYTLTNDARLSDARNPLPNSDNYIQNSTTRQTASSFNIDGTGRADIFNAATQYNLGGNRVLISDGQNNLFAGINAGQANTTGSENAFFGRGAGFSNGFGSSNSFFGYHAGYNSENGIGNTFLGESAGSKSTRDNNTFVGSEAGITNTTGIYNTFLGRLTGYDNTVGYGNTFIGEYSGAGNKLGNYNSSLGMSTYFESDNLTYATAIGAFTKVHTSNTIALGRDDGSDTVVIPGKLEIYSLGTAGTTQLCINAAIRVSTCSSSLRYKTNVAPFSSGLNLVNKLQPITFNWKADNKADLGLGAEDVAKVEPLLVTYNKDGEVEGVKYDRVAVVLLNAVKEQQAQIEGQQKQIEQQQKQIDALKKLVCAQNPTAEICKEP